MISLFISLLNVICLQAIKIIDNMSQQLNPPIRQSFCKNHPAVASGYFLPEQPWIKYCKTCALNVALCGKKIQKDYTPDEFERKLVIQSVVSSMKSNLDRAEENKVNYDKLLAMFEQNAKIMSDRIKEINAALRLLTSAKKQLESLYLEQIEKKAAIYSERQNNFFMSSMQVKRELESIESSFASYIQSEESPQFDQYKSRWSCLLSSYQKDIILQDQYSDIRNKMSATLENFYDKFETITKFTFNSFERKPSRIGSEEDEIDLALTPLKNNCLNQSSQDGKSFAKVKGQLKLRCNKRSQKGEGNTSKFSSKRQSFNVFQSYSDVSLRDSNSK